jgi:hypothetical protein
MPLKTVEELDHRAFLPGEADRHGGTVEGQDSGPRHAIPPGLLSLGGQAQSPTEASSAIQL